MVSYKNERLDQCVDFRARFDDEIDALNFRADVKARLAADLPKNMSSIASECSGSFKDREVMATCTSEKQDGPATIAIVVRYFLFDTALADDRSMHKCIDRKGAWEAIAHDSLEFNAAASEYHLRKGEEDLRDASEKLKKYE